MSVKSKLKELKVGNTYTVSGFGSDDFEESQKVFEVTKIDSVNNFIVAKSLVNDCLFDIDVDCYDEIEFTPTTLSRTISTKEVSDGSTASYYELPEGCTELQHLISYRNMNAQLGEIQRAVYRYGKVAHSDRKRDLKKIIFYAQAELERLEKYEDHKNCNTCAMLAGSEICNTCILDNFKNWIKKEASK